MHVVLVHWNDPELAERVSRLDFCERVDAFHQAGAPLTAALKSGPLAAIIDLGRLPSHGREVAGAIRERKATRGLPLVFVGGQPEKVARARRDFPGATFCEWDEIAVALDRAIADPPGAVQAPVARPAGYSGKPLWRKLGVKAGQVLALLDAPEDLTALDDLPDDVTVRRSARGAADCILLFADSRAGLERRLPAGQRMMREGASLWLAWPKKASEIETDLAREPVRELGLATGLVDTKVCAVDERWSALRFQRRRR